MLKKSLFAIIFFGSLLFNVVFLTVPAYSVPIAGALSIGRTEDFYGNFIHFGCVVHGINVTGYDQLILKDPTGQIVVDSLGGAEIWGPDGAINIFMGGYSLINTGYYTLEILKNNLLESHVLPYEVNDSDIPITTPVITSPTQNFSDSNPSVTVSWEESALPSGYDTISYMVEIIGPGVYEQRFMGQSLETTFILPPGDYTGYVFSNSFKYIEDPNDNSQFQFIQGGVRFVNFAVEAAPVPEPCTVDIHPDTLNKKSKGKYITSYVELPEAYSVEDVDIETVMLSVNGSPIPAELSPTETGDYNDNGIPDFMVKFDRQSVQDVCGTGAVEMILTFQTYDETNFEGSDTVLAIDKGQEHYSEDHGSVIY